MSGKIAFVFPGQGSQAVGMGRDLYEKHSYVKKLYTEASEALGYDVAKLSFEGPREQLDKTFRTQPCLFVAEAAAYAALTKAGLKPDMVAGHSLGEYTAVYASGALDFKSMVKLTETRGKIMQDAVAEGQGLMAAVLGLGTEDVKTICASIKTGRVEPANYNCPGQIVISGERDAVEAALEALKKAGAKRAVALAVSVPSHSSLMDEAAKKLSEILFLDDLKFKEPSIPIISNSDASMITTVDGLKASLVRQLNNPVLWEDSVKLMHSGGARVFVEAGPGKVLSGLVRRILKNPVIFEAGDTLSVEAALREIKKD